MEVDALVSRIAGSAGGSGMAVIALSGGVDSGLAAWTAHAALRDRARAITFISELTPAREAERAEAVAAHIGITFQAMAFSALDDPRVRANGPDRCYHCKYLIFRALRDAVGPEPLLIDGTNGDDDPLRPGLKALREHRVFSPLREAGLGKADVRAMARAVGLPNHAVPPESCLATRIPHGVQLSEEGLQIVEALESHCHSLGIDTLRVRYDNLMAIVEYLPQYSDLINKNRDSVVAHARRIGVGSCDFKEWSE